MAGAAAFVLPSEYESFSIVTLEAMAQRTPVLVNGRCEVLHDHIERSSAGFDYRTPEELATPMERVLRSTLPSARAWARPAGATCSIGIPRQRARAACRCGRAHRGRGRSRSLTSHPVCRFGS